MKMLMKKVTAAFICLVMLLSFSVVVCADDYTIEDAYDEFCALYPEFVEKVKSQEKYPVTDDQILTLLKDIQGSLESHSDEIDEDNFDEYFYNAANNALNVRRNMMVANALASAYPSAAIAFFDGEIPEEFMPLYNTMKSLIFEHNLIGTEDETEEETDEETTQEETTESATEATSESATEETTSETTTESSTEASTEASTETATEASTETATGSETEASTETSGSSTSGGSTGGGTSGSGTTYYDDDEDTSTTGGSTSTTSGTGTTTGGTTGSGTSATSSFSDMTGVDWAVESVNALVNMGIISGYTDGTFKPNANITRAEFAKIIVMVTGRYDAEATCEFTDVSESDWYYSYVASAQALGLINGRGDGTFAPNENITRADICTIVYRYIQTVDTEFGRDAADLSFDDTSSVPDYAKNAVAALSSAGIVNGMGDNLFAPLQYATRAQSAKIVYGVIQSVIG